MMGGRSPWVDDTAVTSQSIQDKGCVPSLHSSSASPPPWPPLPSASACNYDNCLQVFKCLSPGPTQILAQKKAILDWDVCL